jgi:hypothetical protein
MMSTPFVTKLEELGYFKGLAPDKAQVLKREFEQKGWLAIFSDSHRFFMADAEDLAEGGVGQFLREVSPFLASQGVTLPAIEDDRSEDGGYVVRVGSVAHQMYDAAELERDSGDEGGLTWGLSTVRGFRIVDQLLAAAGSAERTYAVNGGNDLFVMFLTPEIHRVIMAQPDASQRDGPYRLREEYPSFGQPESE